MLSVIVFIPLSIENQQQTSYNIEFGHVSKSILKGNLTINDIKVDSKSDSTSLQNQLFKISLNKLKLEGISLRLILFDKSIKINRVIYDNLTISNIESQNKTKKRKDIKPIGFAIGDTKLYLTSTDGKMIIVDLSHGNIIGSEKVSGNFASQPFIFNQNLFIIRNGSIVQYN